MAKPVAPKPTLEEINAHVRPYWSIGGGELGDSGITGVTLAVVEGSKHDGARVLLLERGDNPAYVLGVTAEHLVALSVAIVSMLGVDEVLDVVAAHVCDNPEHEHGYLSGDK